MVEAASWNGDASVHLMPAVVSDTLGWSQQKACIRTLHERQRGRHHCIRRRYPQSSFILVFTMYDYHDCMRPNSTHPTSTSLSRTAVGVTSRQLSTTLSFSLG